MAVTTNKKPGRVSWCMDCARILREEEWPDHDHHQQLPAHPKGMRGAAPIGLGSADVKKVRYVSGLGGFDRCLGGGLVKGTRIYLTGDPGCGKSTLLLLVLWLFAKQGHTVLYLTAEETRLEIEARYRGMGLTVLPNLILYPTESWEAAHTEMVRWRPRITVMDSLNTFMTASAKGDAGDDRQLMKLMALTQAFVQKAPWQPTMLIIGHINAAGDAAGRKAIIHHVTGHIHFSKEPSGIRVLRTKKNRHGGDGEVSLFEFPPNNQLIREVADVSSLLLRDALGRLGSVAYPSVPTERLARPVVVPVECSVSEPKEKGVPRTRASQGIGDKVLEDALDRLTDCGLEFSSRSVRVQCPTFGGEIVADSSAMLAVCLAIVTSHQRRTLPPVGAFGALAASGRVVPDTAAEHRIEALRRAGVGLVFGPPVAASVVPRGVEYVCVQEIGDLASAVLPYGSAIADRKTVEAVAEKTVSMSSPAGNDDGSAP